MKSENPEALQTDYLLTPFYAEDLPDSATDMPIFAELRGLEDRYCKPQVIAMGGLKRILRVFDNKTNRYVAMAQLRSDAPEELFEPFLREARLTALLEHPNIIAVHDIGVGADERPYFTMELKVGDSLGEIVTQLEKRNKEYLKRYTREHLLEIFIKICDAVSFAHAKRVLHLDLKPDNIQVGDYGEVIVCDWGLGKIIGSENDDLEFDELLLNPDLLNNMTLTGTIKGTPGYMAPEQVNDQEKTELTDIYALGAILYALLCHAAPIEGEKQTVFERTRKGEIAPPRKRAPALDIPQSLDAVVMQAMALAPDDRYARVEGLSREIRKYLSGYATEAEQAGLGKQLRLLYLRNQPFFNTIASGVAILGVVGAISVRQLQEKERSAVEARDRAEEALKLYLQEKDHAEEVTKDFLSDLIDWNRTSIQQGGLAKVMARIDRAIELDPENEEAWRQKGHVYFVMQKFRASRAAFEKSGNQRGIGRLAIEFSDDKSDHELLGVDRFTELLSRLAGEPSKKKMILYDDSVRKDRMEHAQLVRVLIKMGNPDWTDEGFVYNPVSRHLKLSGRGLYRLTANTAKNCWLITLDLKSLDLSGTEIVDIRDIKELALEELDLRNTRLDNLNPLKKMKRLKKVTLSEGYDVATLRSLSQAVDVVVAD